jgi:cysteine desulfurase
MYANNEIGTIQPIAEIAKIISEFKEEKRISSPKPKRKRNPPQAGVSGLREEILFSEYPLLHTDAVQAFQFLDCDINKLGVDLMTLSAHKIYGPKGIGVLYRNLRSTIYNLQSNITGGRQEFGLRSGTENVAAIVGFAKAVELVSNSRELENKRIRRLTDHFQQGLKKICPKAEINGLKDLRFMIYDLRRLPNILNVYFPNQNAQDLLMELDLNGIAVSSGSACSARATKPSHVLKAIGLSDKKIKSSLRFSLGKFTTKEEINHVLKIIKKLL